MKESSWQVAQMVLAVTLVSVNITAGGDAIDAEHARNAALFHIAVNVFLVVGLVFSWRMARKARATALLPISAPKEDVVAEVSYEGEPEAFWRCSLQALKRPSTLGRIVRLPLLASITVSAYLAARYSFDLAALLFLPMFAVLTVLWGALSVFFLRREIRSMFPAGLTPQRCSTALTMEGVVDGTPRRLSFLPWKEITEMGFKDGDLFFYAGPRGCFVPREAFSGQQEASEYLRNAQRLRHASKWR